MLYIIKQIIYEEIPKNLQDIHLFLAVKMGVAICKFYGSSFRSHPRPAIFSCTKQFVLLLDIENWCVLSYYFNVLY